MTVSTYTKTGTKAPTPIKLEASVFGVDTSNHELLKNAYIAYLDNSRSNLAQTKTRGEVRGGGRKPWKQKGTGRARFGSIRVPIWRGGGITFGPTGQESYGKKLNVSAKRQAIRQALTLAAKDNTVVVVESLAGKSSKTKDAVNLLSKLGAKGNTLLVVDKRSNELELATNNLPKVIICNAKYLNTYNIVNADSIVIEKDALPAINEWLGAKK